MDEDAFETVAITWSQPEAAVMLAMFASYGIPAFAVDRWQVSVEPVAVTALQGIAVALPTPTASVFMLWKRGAPADDR